MCCVTPPISFFFLLLRRRDDVMMTTDGRTGEGGPCLCVVDHLLRSSASLASASPHSRHVLVRFVVLCFGLV